MKVVVNIPNQIFRLLEFDADEAGIKVQDVIKREIAGLIEDMRNADSAYRLPTRDWEKIDKWIQEHLPR